MKVYVVVEMFLGEKAPNIKGVYKEKAKAEEIKDNYRFAFMSEQYLIQVQTKKKSIEVYVVYELLKLNVPKVLGVFDDENLAKEVAKDCEDVDNLKKIISKGGFALN